MNIIQLLLMIGLWVVTIFKGKEYLNLRDEFIKSETTEQSQELKEAKKAFISVAVVAIIYSIIKMI